LKSKDSGQLPAKRLFLGIPLPEEALQALRHFRQQHAHLRGLRWVPDENLHITLYFFGAVPALQVHNLREMIQARLHEQQAFELKFRAYALAPRPREPRMIWARFDKHPSFTALVGQLDQAYQQIHTNQFNRKSPIPHITLARLKHFTQAREVDLGLPFSPTILPVKELCLWESQLHPSGARYEALARFALSH